MPTNKEKGLLTDIGTKEMAHVEMIATMIYQLMENASLEDLKKAGLAERYTDHGKALFFLMLKEIHGQQLIFKQREML